MKIVAIGGGLIRKGQTLGIDREIVRLAAKKNPKLLFIPTASYDHQGYWQIAQKYFGSLKCQTDVLFLLKKPPKLQEIKQKIGSADIIYVGGGNTLKMMRLWRRLGVDKLLKAAGKRGTVLCGLSAGSICWYEDGHSDSMSFYNPKKWDYILVKGLGFLKGTHCPHYDGATLGIPRRKKFQQMIKKVGGFGIAIENGAAIEYVGEKFRVLATKKSAGAYKIFKQRGKIIELPLPKTKEFLPLSKLYER